MTDKLYQLSYNALNKKMDISYAIIYFFGILALSWAECDIDLQRYPSINEESIVGEIYLPINDTTIQSKY